MTKPGQEIAFGAVGCLPYNFSEVDNLKRYVERTSERFSGSQFPPLRLLVHLGDLRGNTPQCKPEDYSEIRAILTKSEAPVLIVPGENEWTECSDPAEGRRNWFENFHDFPERWGVAVVRQAHRQEHFRLLVDGVMFIGLNLMPPEFHPTREEALSQLEDVSLWLKECSEHMERDVVRAAVLLGHDDFQTGTQPTSFAKLKLHDGRSIADHISAWAESFGRPVIYVHASGHEFIDQCGGWISTDPVFARVEVPGGSGPPIQIAVGMSDIPFSCAPY